MEIRQQSPQCSDIDVIPDGASGPAFRILLPEWIQGSGVLYKGLCHQVPGIWSNTPRGLHGVFTLEKQIELTVAVEPRNPAVAVTLEVRNIGTTVIQNLWADVCTSLNHLPGAPGWSNRSMLGDLELDRALQGRHWYESVTPRRLKALTGHGWVPMHPAPDRPDADTSPLYRFEPSRAADAIGCAVASADGTEHCFQGWDTPCRYCTPCPGNACMHLKPFLTDVLEPRGKVVIRGLVGMHQGDVHSLEQLLERVAHAPAPGGAGPQDPWLPGFQGG